MQYGIRYHLYHGIKKPLHFVPIIILIAGFWVGPTKVSVYAQPQDTSCVGENGFVNWYFYNNINGNYIESLQGHPYFPQVPDGDMKLFSLQTQYKFNDYFGSMSSGFIKPPESGNYIFNVTGDNHVRFYLSDGTDPDNAIQLCESYWDWIDYHDEDTSQTSDTFQLVADRYYYFEFRHKESSGTDHAQVYWKTPFYADSVWTLIHGSYLYNNNCHQICDPAGTLCDDGDSLTINDIQDGFCNCSGERPRMPLSQANCMGERGKVTALYYDTINSSNINNLYNAPKYPLNPDRADVLDAFSIPRNQNNNYGTLLRGYINVPVEGWYQFNITGDDDSELFLKNHFDEDSLYRIAYVDGWTDETDHYKYASQTSDSFYLTTDIYYMIQMTHKEGGGGDNLDLYWRTPFIPDTSWTAVGNAYIYEYSCAQACIPEGTPCNDGNPNTKDDAYDADCNCVGTPCGGPCEDEPTYVAYDACAPTEKHSNHQFDSWLSCVQDTSPNAARGLGHWILYDFGESLLINETKVWNYNVEGQTGKGAKTVAVDISNDQTTWEELGQVEWQEADGTHNYEGELLSILDGQSAQYLLLTILDTWTPDTCAGFSEIQFKVEACPDAGTPCDDGDPNTLDDMVDPFCKCSGLPIPVNYCDTAILSLNQAILKSGHYDATEQVIAEGKELFGSSATLVAGESITLLPGFEVEKGAAFLATIEPCTTPPIPPAPHRIIAPEIPEAESGEPGLQVHQKQGSSWANAYFNLNNPSLVSMYLIKPTGEIEMSIINKKKFPAGDHSKKVPVQNIKDGIYTLVLKTGDGTLTRRFMVEND